jgi:hypothetical protein
LGQRSFLLVDCALILLGRDLAPELVSRALDEVDRSILRSLLLQWGTGKLSEKDVHETAEGLWERHEWPEYCETDDRSIAIEVLAHLEILNHQLITRDDVPALLDFLDTPPGQAARGWIRWRQYWDGIDFAQRRRELATNPYYIT